MAVPYCNQNILGSLPFVFPLQVCKWPINPLDRIIEGIKRTAPQGAIIVDCGCGDAKLAKILKPLGYTV